MDQVYCCWYVLTLQGTRRLSDESSSAIPGSFVFAMLFLPLYAVVAPAIGFSTEYAGIVPRLWTDGVFYFMLIVIPIVCLARDFTWKQFVIVILHGLLEIDVFYVQLSTDVHAIIVPHRSRAAKVQYTRLPSQTGTVRDYVLVYTLKPLRYHIDRFQKAIKKVRAVQRMRRNRGFAFSQTENAGRQDQAKLIRAYDTSKSSSRPSGYQTYCNLLHIHRDIVFYTAYNSILYLYIGGRVYWK